MSDIERIREFVERGQRAQSAVDRVMEEVKGMPEAIIATLLYRAEFVQHEGDLAQFFASLAPEQQRVCEFHAGRVIRAWRWRQAKARR